jgi:hypothetical protein
MCRRLARIAIPICAALACRIAPVMADDSDAPANQTSAATGQHGSIISRLVYIEAKSIKAGTPCNKDSFGEARTTPEKGTGFLLSDARVLTAYHVALRAERVASGYIRCYAVYRDESRGVAHFARPYLSQNLNDDGDIQIWKPRDVAMLQLTEPIDDKSLKVCPRISRRRFDGGEQVFVVGYKGNTIDIPMNKGITDPQVHPTAILHPCRPPATCDVNQAAPAGVSGGPVVDKQDALVGVLKGGDNAQSEFQPVMDMRADLEGPCDPRLARDQNDIDQCIDAGREARAQATAKSEFKEIQCSAAGEASDKEPLSFSAPKGFRISGFTKHTDSTDPTGNGWVGDAEYTLSDDRLHVTRVKVQLGCNGKPTASGQPGWAKTILKVDIKKILEDNDSKEIRAKCSAY